MKQKPNFLKKPEASKLLKEYYILWLAALDSVAPDIGEREIDYENRKNDKERKLKEAWLRFEIESEL